ncbi:MAG: hypothetical protein IPM91_04740 [Bacteroidetes bacterium]|nr:hypothetical protein [Bacteroidota bacterium]
MMEHPQLFTLISGCLIETISEIGLLHSSQPVAGVQSSLVASSSFKGGFEDKMKLLHFQRIVEDIGFTRKIQSGRGLALYTGVFK